MSWNARRVQYRETLIGLGASGVANDLFATAQSDFQFQEAIAAAQNENAISARKQRELEAVSKAGGIPIPPPVTDAHYKLFFNANKAEIREMAQLGFLLDQKARPLMWNEGTADATVRDLYFAGFGLKEGGLNRQAEIWRFAIDNAIETGRKFIAQASIKVENPTSEQLPVILGTNDDLMREPELPKTQKVDMGRLMILIGATCGAAALVVAVVAIIIKRKS